MDLARYAVSILIDYNRQLEHVMNEQEMLLLTPREYQNNNTNTRHPLHYLLSTNVRGGTERLIVSSGNYGA
jgi:hypothetical protein